MGRASCQPVGAGPALVPWACGLWISGVCVPGACASAYAHVTMCEGTVTGKVLAVPQVCVSTTVCVWGLCVSWLCS